MRMWLQLGLVVCGATLVACGNDNTDDGATPLKQHPQLVNPGFLAVPITKPGTPVEADISIVNDGQEELDLTNITLTGQDASLFTLGTPSTTAIAARQASAIPVTFSPIAVGAYVANVNITSNAENFPSYVIDVTAPCGDPTDDTARLEAADKSVSITIPAGQTEAAGVLRYYNVGEDSLIITGYSFTGANASSFSLADGTPLPGGQCTLNGSECDQGLFCLLPTSNAPQGNCALSVPIADPVVLDIYYNGTGSGTATLKITPQTGVPASIPLSGTHA